MVFSPTYCFASEMPGIFHFSICNTPTIENLFVASEAQCVLTIAICIIILGQKINFYLALALLAF